MTYEQIKSLIERLHDVAKDLCLAQIVTDVDMKNITVNMANDKLLKVTGELIEIANEKNS